MARDPGEYKTYAQKMQRADREALYSVVALAIIIVAWLVGGVGLAGSDLQVASTPIWVIGGTFGTWIVSVIVAVILAKRVFANFPMDADDDEVDSASATVSDGTGEPR